MRPLDDAFQTVFKEKVPIEPKTKGGSVAQLDLKRLLRAHETLRDVTKHTSSPYLLTPKRTFLSKDEVTGIVEHFCAVCTHVVAHVQLCCVYEYCPGGFISNQQRIV